MGKQSRRKDRNMRPGPHLPPAPPGAERLRSARDVIDPDAIYHMTMPDGTVFMARGSSLIEAADATVAAPDAIGAGAADVIAAAFDRLNASCPSSVMVCTRIGQIQGYPLPPGYLTAECYRCHAPVWISPENHRRVARSGFRPICSVCLPPETR